ncbi:MAG TPA: Na+/H+ antiporter [Steroidobacteraceae bacterium]|nr:Na+/H+ antiporter [Steroidobacteraceae bacterium]
MIETIRMLVALLAVLAVVALLAVRLKIPASILLVLVGIGLTLLPGLPTVQLAPEIMLLLVLPPLVYSASVAMSWREFRFNLRPISLLAIGCVLFTTWVTAAAAHWVLGLSWSLGALLGAIVSPPDSIAPLAIARRMRLPRRILVILEGEGLADDATALILYRFAVVAVSAGAFSVRHAVGSFLGVLAGEVLWGIAVGWLMLRLRRWVREPRVEITLSLITPYLAYWPPEHLGGSGVLATVTAGLYISWNGLRLISAATRLQGVFFWGFLIYLIEGLVFLVTGLQARSLVAGIDGYSAWDLLDWAALISVVVILARFVWIYPATYVPRWLSASLRRRDPSPPWQFPFVLAFTGVRGVVSLAAALAIPLTTDTGRAFPERNLIVFLTFAVILVTLVGQGLALPAVIRWLGLASAGDDERTQEREAEYHARREGARAALQRLEQIQQQQNIESEQVRSLRQRHLGRLAHAEQRIDGDPMHRELSRREEAIEALLIEAERGRINDLYRDGELKDEPRRRIERELDLRDAQLENLREEP